MYNSCRDRQWNRSLGLSQFVITDAQLQFIFVGYEFGSGTSVSTADVKLDLFV